MTKKNAINHIVYNELDRLSYKESEYWTTNENEDLKAIFELCFIGIHKVYKIQALRCIAQLENILRSFHLMDKEEINDTEKTLKEFEERIKPWNEE